MGPSDPKGKPYQGSTRVQMPERTTATFLGLPVPFADEDGLGILYKYLYICTYIYYDIFGLPAFADVGRRGILGGCFFLYNQFLYAELCHFPP